MKQYIVTGAFILFALFASVDSFAQNEDPAARQAQMKQKLMTDLKMTDLQADSVVAINSSYRPQFKEIYQDQSLSEADRNVKMKAIAGQADNRIKPVLGDSLYQQYKEWRKQNMQQMRAGKPGNN